MIHGALPKPPRFLTVEEVLSLHEAAIDEHGGSHGVRDAALLDSAVAMPKQGFAGAFAHPIPFGMAAAYAFHIGKNHPFVDGNKRTAFIAAAVFLRINGWDLLADDNDAAEQFLAVATGVQTKEGLGEWLAAHAKARSSLELRDFFSELSYQTLASTIGAVAAGPPNERVATRMEAARAIPAIHAANIGAVAAEAAGDLQAAIILRQHAIFMTALVRLAEDRGYEW